MTTPTTAAAAAASTPTTTTAKQALQQLLQTPPSTLDPAWHHHPVVVAHARLQLLREQGDPDHLLIRSALEILSCTPPPATTNPTTTTASTADDEELLFHCITGYRQIVLWRYGQQQQQQQQHQTSTGGGYSRIFVAWVRDWFMLVGHALAVPTTTTTTTTTTTAAVGGGLPRQQQQYQQNRRSSRMACYTASVALWKRGWNDHDDSGNGQVDSSQQQLQPMEQALVQEMMRVLAAHFPTIPLLQHPFATAEQLLYSLFPSATAAAAVAVAPTNNKDNNDGSASISSAVFPSMEAAATILHAMVSEFATAPSSSAIDYRMPLEFHKAAHRAFERGCASIATKSTSSSKESPSSSPPPPPPLDQCLQWSLQALQCLCVGQQQVGGPNTFSSTMDIFTTSTTMAAATAVLQLLLAVLQWEFGMTAFDRTNIGAAVGASAASRTLFRPPTSWRQYSLVRIELIQALFAWHANIITTTMTSSSASSNAQQQQQQLAHLLRQVLLTLASMTGSIFHSPQERCNYATVLIQGCQPALDYVTVPQIAPEQSSVLDLLHLTARIVTNYRLNTLMMLTTTSTTTSDPNQGFPALLQSLSRAGHQLLHDVRRECQEAGGDVESMMYKEWREEALTAVLDCVVSLCEDPWLRFGITSGASTEPEAITTIATTDQQQQHQQQAKSLLAQLLGPLYAHWVEVRCEIAALEEYYAVSHPTDVDPVREEIGDTATDEEMTSVATMGRLDLTMALQSLSTLFGKTVPPLQAAWNNQQIHADSNSTQSEMAPEIAALLEQTRVLTMCIAYLLTDNNDGESPTIPDAILIACDANPSCTEQIAAAVQAILHTAQSQVQALSVAQQLQQPSPHSSFQQLPQQYQHPRMSLSPLLAKTFLRFLHRWAPAYMYPPDYVDTRSGNSAVRHWSRPDITSNILSFCLVVCMNYAAYWPHESQVQESVSDVLLALANRAGPVRKMLRSQPAFMDLLRLHCWTATVRHHATPTELESFIRSQVVAAGASGGASSGSGDGVSSTMLNLVRGYHRLPYPNKARILSAILVACSDPDDITAEQMTQDALRIIHDAFISLMETLTTRNTQHNSRAVDISHDLNTKEMVNLCVEMFTGIVHASEMDQSDRIPAMLTNYLPQLSMLMNYYASDLTVCEGLLRFFRDYTELFIVVLNREQSLVLFHAAASLLRSYSQHHCHSRVVPPHRDTTNKPSTTSTGVVDANDDEDQAYSDILTALQLLTNLGAKDFIDAFEDDAYRVDGGSGSGSNNNNNSSSSSSGPHPGSGGSASLSTSSSQITDTIFFGLQQILPLMTAGLLQYPALCSQFFDLVGFMVDTYPDKVCALPYDLFDALIQSLLFGIRHYDALTVAKTSLQAVASLAREHLSSHALQGHLMHHPDIFHNCARHLLNDVIFQHVVMDRIEAAGMALLPIVAVDVIGFATIVHELCHQIPDLQQRVRLQAAFDRLIQPDVLVKVCSNGYEGRMNRVQFKHNFEEFVNDIHSFLVLK